MKLASTIAIAAALIAAPLQSQAFFGVDQKALDYKLHILECAALLGSPDHAAKCGGGSPAPSSDSLSTQSPAATEKDGCIDWGLLLGNIAIGERVHVAVSCQNQ